MSMEAAAEHAADALRELRTYADMVVVDPARLAEVEARLSLIAQLERRWGDSVAEVIAYGEQASQEADQLEGQEADLAEIRAAADALLRQIEIAALELSASRREAAQRFVAAILEECQTLHLEGTVVEIAFESIRVAVDGRAISAPDDAQVGFDPTGMDRIELLVSFNPDAPPRPLQAGRERRRDGAADAGDQGGAGRSGRGAGAAVRRDRRGAGRSQRRDGRRAAGAAGPVASGAVHHASAAGGVVRVGAPGACARRPTNPGRWWWSRRSTRRRG